MDVAEDLLRTEYRRRYKKGRHAPESHTVPDEVASSSKRSVAKKPSNMFDTLLKQSTTEIVSSQDEIDRYLVSGTEDVEDVLTWWRDPTSVEVERTFSRGRLCLPYVRNRLSVQSTRAQLCVGNWSRKDYILDTDVLAASRLPELRDDEVVELEEGWDKIYF
ncbi:hypothetical protein CPC08DRAFT_730936 [Agrocybe pediades]|nr:hypothetical protein CPC08DRAFT_730936 [Agrocybe pediades]